MILRFTGKLSKKLKTGPLTKIDEDPGPYLDWYANLFTAQRYQYILVTEAKSLLSIVMHGGGVTDDDKFIKQFLSQLHEYLNDTGNRLIYERIIVPQTGVIKMSKTASKSVLGSMNDMINLSKIYLEDEELGPWDLMKMINRTPFKAINYDRPEEAFRKMKLS